MTPLLAQRPRTDRSFERLYRRYVGDVYRYSLAVLRNPSDAEDVTQTTFMNAYRAFQRGERPDSPHNWLIAIAHNVCRQRFRQAARRPQEVTFDDDIADRIEDDDAPSAEDIRRALGHLAFNQRAALVMRELEGRSYQEIGEILDLSVSAVETLIFRARRALREQLEGSLTCGEAELAISKQLDGRLARAEKGQLRAHLRECRDCATFARRQRAQRAALKSIAAVPLPSSLASFFGGGGGATLAGAAGAKFAALGLAGALVAGGGYEAVTHVSASHRSHPRAAATTRAHAAARAGEVALPRVPVGSVARPTRIAAPATERDAAQTVHGTPGPKPQPKAHGQGAQRAAHPQHPEHPAQAHGPNAGKAHGRSHAASVPRHSRVTHVKKPKRRQHRRTHVRHASPPSSGHTSHGNGGNGGNATNANGNGSSNGNGHGHSSGSSPVTGVTNLLPTVTVPTVTIPKPPKK